MGSMKRNSYSKEFKTNAVKLITQEGRKASEVARELHLSANMLYLWKSKYESEKQDSFPGKGKLNSKDDYIRQLEQENKRLKDERDILKKAAMYFAREE
jgi:transposase